MSTAIVFNAQSYALILHRYLTVINYYNDSAWSLILISFLL